MRSHALTAPGVLVPGEGDSEKEEPSNFLDTNAVVQGWTCPAPEIFSSPVWWFSRGRELVGSWSQLKWKVHSVSEENRRHEAISMWFVNQNHLRVALGKTQRGRFEGSWGLTGKAGKREDPHGFVGPVPSVEVITGPSVPPLQPRGRACRPAHCFPFPKHVPKRAPSAFLSSISPLHISSQLLGLLDLRCPSQRSSNSSLESSALGRKHILCLLEKALVGQGHGMPRTCCQEG